MKTDCWKRLASLAQQAPGETTEFPYDLETRVIAEWRNVRSASSAFPWLFVLRSAVACSAAALLLAVASHYRAFVEPDQPAIALANDVMRISMLP